MHQIPLNDLSRVPEAESSSLAEITEKIIESGQFLHGKWTLELEQKLSERINKHVTCVGNGTDALNLAMMISRVRKGKKVITVANAGGYATGAILRCGGMPLFVDVEANSGQMDMSQLEYALSENSDVVAVVVTHLYGQLANIALAKEICAKYEVILIEDCAQGLGCRLDGKEAGSWGDITTMSFYPTKNLGALGDGGAIGVKDKNQFDLVKSLAQYGWVKRYEIQHELGFNTRIDEIQAAVLVNRLSKFDSNNSIRREIVKSYSEALGKSRYFLASKDASYVGHLAILVGDSRDKDIEFLESRGIATGIHYPILDTKQSAWHEKFMGINLPVSERLSTRIITLPCFPSMTKDEISFVVDALKDLPEG